MKYQQGFVQLDFTSLFVFLIAIGIILGISSSIGIPVMWEWVKPFIHAWTA